MIHNSVRYIWGTLVTTALMALLLVVWSSPAAQAEPSPPEPAVTIAGAASLHNPGFDNHDWYEFHLRYQGDYPSGAWLPDDDNNVGNNIPDSIRQDWRLWFLDGKDIVEPDPEKTYVLYDEAVQMRTYGGATFWPVSTSRFIPQHPVWSTVSRCMPNPGRRAVTTSLRLSRWGLTGSAGILPLLRTRRCTVSPPQRFGDRLNGISGLMAR